MGTTKDVKERIPGLQFRLVQKKRGNKTLGGTQHGRIELACEFTDPAMFEAAAAKLSDFKIFSNLAEEIVEAIGEELDTTDRSLKQAQREIVALKAELKAKEAEIERLQGLLKVIDDDLADAKGEAVFNDYE